MSSEKVLAGPTSGTGVTRRILTAVAVVFLVPAVVIFFSVVLLTTLDVLARLVLNKPMTGVVDLTKIMMVMLCWLGGAWAMVKKRHVVVDILVDKMHPKAQLIIGIINTVLGFIFIAVVVWGGTIYAIKSYQIRTTFETLNKIPDAPLRFAIVAGASLLCIVMAFHFFEQLNKAVKGMGEGTLQEASHKEEAGNDAV